MKILFAVSEIFPFCKTGGLADVAGALAQVFSHFENSEISVFVPKYKTSCGFDFKPQKLPVNYEVNVGKTKKPAKLFKLKWGKVKIYFIENDEYFARANLYGTKRSGYKDNDKRFIFFSKAVLEGAKLIGFTPDIIHSHDWQTGLIPVYLKTLYRNFRKTKTLLTIHNLAYQGNFFEKSFGATGLAPEFFGEKKLKHHNGINFLKCAIIYADAINTVSPTYAKEVLISNRISFGLTNILKSRTKDFFAILNGLDTNTWNPENDALIPETYGLENFSDGKKSAKLKLQKNHNLTINSDIPLIGIVSRLDYQKGLDIAADAIVDFKGKCQFAVLGMGDLALEKKFKNLAKKLEGNLFFVNKLNETLAHNIYAASDIFLMPSRYEPCGLSQMIALKYGALPLVTKTGGLADTVSGFGESRKPNGFFIRTLTKKSLCDALNTAIVGYRDKTLWYNMVRNAMRADFSWDRSAKKYMAIFEKLAKYGKNKNDG